MLRIYEILTLARGSRQRKLHRIGSPRFFCIVLYCSYYSPFKRKRTYRIFRTVRPHSLGGCHLRVVWATCFPRKDGGVQSGELPKDITSELVGLSSITSPKCRPPSREAVNIIFKVFWYDLTRGMNPKSTDCEADALTTKPSCQFILFLEIANSTKTRIINVGLQQLHKVDVERGLAVLLG